MTKLFHDDYKQYISKIRSKCFHHFFSDSNSLINLFRPFYKSDLNCLKRENQSLLFLLNMI